MLSRLKITDESYTAVYPAADNLPPLIGQVQHSSGVRSAHLTFLLPTSSDLHPGIADLIDELSSRAGEMGAVNLLAEVRDSDPLLEEMRKNSFSIYSWETIWKLPMDHSSAELEIFQWEPSSTLDEPGVRSLYQTLVPPIVQAAEPFPGSEPRRLVYRVNGDLVAYVESTSGPRGIYLKPVIHPSAEHPREMILSLMHIFHGIGRPVYFQMRSYQAWITRQLEEIGAETSVHFALLVRHLAQVQYVTERVRQVRMEVPPATVARNMTDSKK